MVLEWANQPVEQIKSPEKDLHIYEIFEDDESGIKN